MTWFTRVRKSIIESSTMSRFFANLQSFNQIWTLVSTARRNLAGNSSLRRSFALKIDFWWFIMFARDLRHWTPTLSSPNRITEATVNIRSCFCSSWKFIGGWTSCLFNALILWTDIPQPWVRISWRVRWQFFCSAARIGSLWQKRKGSNCLGCRC